MELDGLYRHCGAMITWDRHGVTVLRTGPDTTTTATWDRVLGARQIGERPGFVQLLIRDHIPPQDPQDDRFSIAVNSDPDAQRLVTSIGWRAASGERQCNQAKPRRGWLRRRHRA